MPLLEIQDSTRRAALPMRIAVVTETYPPEVNGVAMTLQRLTMGLLQLGHQVTLVRPRQHTYDRPGCCKQPRTVLVKGATIPGYSEIRLGLTSKARMLRQWQEDCPQVIYIATEGPLGNAALRAARQLDIPVVTGFHTNFHQYTRHYRLGWLEPVVWSYLKKFHNQTYATLVPNQKLADALQQAGINNTHILSRGVDCQLYDAARRDRQLRRDWGVDDNGIVMLYVGRMANEKNLMLAVESYKSLCQQGNVVKFVMVGDGPLYDGLSQQHPEIIYCGFQHGEDLARYYASADVFVFPSETETFGNVVLEAMASGLAIVGYDYAAAQMHLEDGLNARLIPLGDREAFITAVCQLVKQPETILRLRRGVRDVALGIDWGYIIDVFARLLKDAAHVVAAEQSPEFHKKFNHR
jgi:glycosyltransferase involved in cell wall biosynthesis